MFNVKCIECGSIFSAKRWNAKYCEHCRKVRVKAQNKANYLRRRDSKHFKDSSETLIKKLNSENYTGGKKVNRILFFQEFFSGMTEVSYLKEEITNLKCKKLIYALKEEWIEIKVSGNFLDITRKFGGKR